MTTYGKEFLQSATEALAIAKGDMEPARTFSHPAIDVAAIRKRTGLSQVRFAERYGFSPGIVRDWEQGRRAPDRIARTLLTVIAREKDAVDRALEVSAA